MLANGRGERKLRKHLTSSKAQIMLHSSSLFGFKTGKEGSVAVVDVDRFLSMRGTRDERFQDRSRTFIMIDIGRDREQARFHILAKRNEELNSSHGSVFPASAQ